MNLALPFAHALVAKQDLPLPAWLFAWAASIVLVVSFFALSAAWRKPQFEDERWRPSAAWLTTVLRSWPIQVLCGGLAVLLLCVGIWSGIHGTEAPDRNFAITFYFVTVWIGFAFVSALFGDVFPAFNPWRAIARVAGGAYGLLARRRPRHLAYPEKLGRWPAAVGLLAFVWLEVVYGSSGGVAVGLEPHAAGVAACVYSGYTLAMMALFGTEKWCARGEIFSVYFGMFSQLAPFGVRDGRIGRRRPLAAAAHWATGVPGSTAVVIASIASTSFDGAEDGAYKAGLESVGRWIEGAGVGPLATIRITDSIFMAGTVLAVGGVYLLGVRGMRSVPGAPAFRELHPRLRPHPDPDRPRLPGRPLLQPLRLPGAGPVHLPTVRPAGDLDHRPLRHRRIRHRLQRADPQRHLVRPGRGAPRRPRPRSDPGPRSGAGLLARLPPRLTLPVLDARGDGRLHLLRPLPALGGRDVMRDAATTALMTLPLAHIGHWLWAFYVMPVLIVIGGIIRSTRAEKKREREEEAKRRPAGRR